MPIVDWYFDFISPFSYICLHRMRDLQVRLTYQPVLFAGLLDQFGQKGPAEIPAKRRWTYRWCTWWAKELGIPFRFPAAHPFNSLQHLRLAIACGNTPEAIERIFDWIWTAGEDACDPTRFASLCKSLRIDESQLGRHAIKAALKDSTQAAAQRGVFGVPSFVADGEVFWGADAIDFLQAFLVDPAIVRSEEMRRVDALPVGAERKS